MCNYRDSKPWLEIKIEEAYNHGWEDTYLFYQKKYLALYGDYYKIK